MADNRVRGTVLIRGAAGVRAAASRPAPAGARRTQPPGRSPGLRPSPPSHPVYSAEECSDSVSSRKDQLKSIIVLYNLLTSTSKYSNVDLKLNYVSSQDRTVLIDC